MLLTVRCADGNWINIGYYKTLLGMGYTEVEFVIVRNQSLRDFSLESRSNSSSPSQQQHWSGGTTVTRTARLDPGDHLKWISFLRIEQIVDNMDKMVHLFFCSWPPRREVVMEEGKMKCR